MAEFLKVEIKSESFFNSLEDEILSLFEKLTEQIKEKRENILEALFAIRQDYQNKEKNRLKKLSEYNEFKQKLTNTDTKLNEIMEIRDDQILNIENKISQLITPYEFPKVFFQYDHLDSILAKINTIQLITSESEPVCDLETSLDQLLRDNIDKLPGDTELISQRHSSLIRHMTLQKRSSSIFARPITDIKIVSNRSQIPVGYSALDSTAAGKEVQLWDVRLRVFTVKHKRYLCYTRQTMDALSIKEGTTKRSRIEIPESDEIVVTDIRLLNASTSEFIPLDYEIVERTVDQNEPSLHKHILLVKYEKKLETETAVSQIMFLEENQKDNCLPPKFSSVSVPINGYYICFNSDFIENSSESSSLQKGANL